MPNQIGLLIRLAGISGATAVALAAYGAHGGKGDEHKALLFDTANRHHFYHTLALLGATRCRKPLLVGCLLSSGIVIFSGSIYYQAITGDSSVRTITPFGGILLIAGWLAMAI